MLRITHCDNLIMLVIFISKMRGTSLKMDSQKNQKIKIDGQKSKNTKADGL